MSEKISFQVISRNIVGSLLGSPASEVIFGDKSFPRLFSVLVSDEGQRNIIEVKEQGIIVHVAESTVVDAIIQFTDTLSDEKYKSYKLDYEKAKKVMKYWQALCPEFPDEIKPVLQKSTKGYCYHRLDFDMEQSPTPTFDYLLGNLENNHEAFLGFLGALFDPHKTLQQYLWLAGSGGDGKGSLFRLLARIFNQSYCSIATDNRAVDKYWQSLLVGKRLAVSGDTRNLDFINSATFMQVSGGDHVTVRPMYQQAYTAKLSAMFILGANGDPMVTSEDSGQRRAIVCRFRRRVGDDQVFIQDFEEKLWNERAGILKKCWVQWLKFRNLLRIPVDQESLRRLGEDTEEMQQQLVDRYFEIKAGAYVSSSQVITVLKEGEKRPLNNFELSAWKRYLGREHGVVFENVRINGVRTKIYKGLCLKGVQVDSGSDY